MTDTFIEAMNLEGGIGKLLQNDDMGNPDPAKEHLAKQSYITLTDSDVSQSTCTTNASNCEATGQVVVDQLAEEASSEESMFSGYFPHLSVGVAAVAAIAGLFVLKRNT